MAFATVSAASYLGRARFPAAPYDDDHGQAVSNLVSPICAFQFGMAGNELWLAQRVGLLHDLGRAHSDWRTPDPGHGRRGAELALHVIAYDPDWRALGQDAFNRVAVVIANHDITRKPGPDPISVALHDADLMEAARLPPAKEIYADALKVYGDPMKAAEATLASPFIQQRYARLITPWANRNRQLTWIGFRSPVRTVGHGIRPGAGEMPPGF